MNTSFTFTVFGIPQPQGSTKAFLPKGWTRPIITSANAKVKPWRQQIAQSCLTEMHTYGVPGWMAGEPVEVVTRFIFEKPKSASKKVVHKVTKPDGDKLVRAIWDALTGIAFKDDSQVVKWSGTKEFGSPARVIISVGPPSFTGIPI